MTCRIRILGGSGVGKSTLARQLGNELAIDTIIHIDDIFWQLGWIELDDQSLHQQIKQKIRDKENWIIDGNYTRLNSLLLPMTTHLIIIHPPLFRNLWQLFWREIGRRTSWLPATPPPKQVADEVNDEPLWRDYWILAQSSIRAYTYRNKEKVEKISNIRPELPIIIYRGPEMYNQLIDRIKVT